MAFEKESEFESALINLLFENGWEREVLKNPTEKDLLKNWAGILFKNNRQRDRLNNVPLTDGEMGQIMEQIKLLRTPLRLNGFINGRTVSVKRDNPADALHFGKDVSLKIYDRQEIAAGQSRYQIAEQPAFPTPGLYNDRRGDVMLLINGMPVIHLELKRSGVPVSQACGQIEKYAHEGVFSGLFSLIQVFVAMNPEETLYFANPGPDGRFNPDYYFHWADFNNERINDWREIASKLISIPMAHQLIGFYTVADDTDGVLKVMRSYQYFAASRVSDRAAKARWGEKDSRGGFIWHTTGSGKTLTSFKAAQLIAASKDADKVVFLMDRVELGTQSLQDYQGFAEDDESVQATENTDVLIGKLKSADPADTLIVTSIQKMSIAARSGGKKGHDIGLIAHKRLVFIIDEAHRSVFGEMLIQIKAAFPDAVLFGFTGTPIQEENKKKGSATVDIFGDELHRYSIADGIRDKSVLGFDPCMVMTYPDYELRKAAALEKARAKDETEALADPQKKEVYLEYMNGAKWAMAGHEQADGTYVSGIEDFVPQAQYETEGHRQAVVEDILNHWLTLSRAGKFHALFAVSSIPEAIEYYQLFRKLGPALKVCALFDPSTDNPENLIYKEDAIVEMLKDYNARYGREFSMKNYASYKKDVSERLAHKKPYMGLENSPEQQIDILIVVNQMLTGFDSKWINTLYLDKRIEYEQIIQAFSRTNRLFGPDKPFGTIRYYRYPHSMERNIEEAFRLYSGSRPMGIFADKLEKNLEGMNAAYDEMAALFHSAGFFDFEKLPGETAEKAQFAKLFKTFSNFLEAAEIQGFTWEKSTYDFPQPDGTTKTVRLHLDRRIWHVLGQRYKELRQPGPSDPIGPEDIPFEIDPHLSELDTGVIDADYMNSRFEKWKKALLAGDQQAQELEQELHRSFASLSQEEQKYANIFLHDFQSGDVRLEEGKTLRDYITAYCARAKNDQIHKFAAAIGADEELLRAFMNRENTPANLNVFGRFDQLKASVKKETARAYFERAEGAPVKAFKVPIKLDAELRRFILEDGFDINDNA